MTKTLLTLLAAITVIMSPSIAQATEPVGDAPAAVTAEIGKPAPAFTATDSNGKTHNLSDFAGKTVVLEWTSHECPYVRKHYDSGNMQGLQKDATDKGIIWLTVVSSAPDKQGYTDADEANRVIDREKSAETARLLDPTGALGKLYGASTTPHMFVIDGAGTLVYAGAIDDKPSVSASSLEGAQNYVKDALADLAAGTAVKVASSKPYGCGVKY